MGLDSTVHTLCTSEENVVALTVGKPSILIDANGGYVQGEPQKLVGLTGPGNWGSNP